MNYRERVKQIFADVPPDHKFWLKTGGEVSNLEDMSLALKDMDEEVFVHHVNDEKNDFADWIQNVVKDEDLASTLHKIKTQEGTRKALELRISSLKNIEVIHTAIDKVKEKIAANETSEPEIKKNFESTLSDLKKRSDHHKKNFIKDMFGDTYLYLGLLVGFAIGVILGIYL